MNEEMIDRSRSFHRQKALHCATVLLSKMQEFQVTVALASPVLLDLPSNTDYKQHGDTGYTIALFVLNVCTGG